MKKSVWFFILIAFLCLIFMFIFIFKKHNDNQNLVNLSDSSECQKVNDIKKRGYLKVGIKVDVPKFSFLDPETNREEGFEPDLARAIAIKMLGSENAIKFRPITPKTRGPLLDNNELDFVIATFTITEKRKQSYNFTEPYYTDYIGFLVNKNSDLRSVNDFLGKIIGVSQSTPTKACLQKKSQELRIELKFAEYTSYHELKVALATGRIDAFSADKSILHGYQDENTVILNDVICKQDYGAACKLENKVFCEYLNKIIGEIKNEGLLENLIKKWGLESNGN